jgi:uncharacterized iron-regulated membrane protein
MHQPISALWPHYRTVWRWHFYAGLFSLPFVLILSITGAIYLFKPQIEAWEDSKFAQLATVDSIKPVSEQVHATLQAIPESRFNSFEIPENETDAGRVIIGSATDSVRCYVHPASLAILNQSRTDQRFISVVKRVHGELLLGPWGSYLVELAACWTIVMILTGLFLWWPRKIVGLAGIVYPRLLSGPKLFWRDIHSVTGVWISAFALILIVTGLPWTAFWGEYFKSIRRLTGTAVTRQDWTSGSSVKMQDPNSSHEGHGHAASNGNDVASRKRDHADFDLLQIDRVVASVRPLGLRPPIVVSPPDQANGDWTVKSNTPNRPQRVTLKINGKSGDITSRETFADRHWLDRIVGTGIALHEGQLFGWVNQAIGLVTALGLVLLSFSGTVLWWRRRHIGSLGAPKIGAISSRRSPAIVACIVVLAIYLPIFGASLILVLLLDKLVLRRIPRLSRWAGLTA